MWPHRCNPSITMPASVGKPGATSTTLEPGHVPVVCSFPKRFRLALDRRLAQPSTTQGQGWPKGANARNNTSFCSSGQGGREQAKVLLTYTTLDARIDKNGAEKSSIPWLAQVSFAAAGRW
jgi:hypothetical protein